MRLKCSLLFVVHEDDEEPLEENDCIEVDAQTLIHGIPARLALCVVDDLLHVVQGEGAEEEESSIEPNVEQSLAWPEHLSD